MTDSKTYILLRILLELLYSFSKQYAAFYEREIKNVVK